MCDLGGAKQICDRCKKIDEVRTEKGGELGANSVQNHLDEKAKDPVFEGRATGAASLAD